jgi:hypothetical protein
MPGASRTFEVPVELTTVGTFRVEFDLVHEERSWFNQRGGRTAVVMCEVK